MQPHLLLLLPVLALADSAHRLPSLSPRQSTFTGGWALRKTSCPASTTTCPDIEGLPACCPKNTNCHTGYSIGREWVACCPDNNAECDKLLKPLPVCADEKWVLWQGQKYKADVFCCEAGEVGYLPADNSDNPACGPANLDIASSLTASTVKPAYQTKAGAGTTKTGATGSAQSEDDAVTGNAPSEDDAATGSATEDEIAASLLSGGKDSESKEDTGLGAGAIAGIAIGAVAVVGLLALGFFWVHRMGQRKERAAMSSTVPDAQHPYPQPYLPPQVTGTTVTGELDSKTTPGVQAVPELDARRE